MSNLDADALAIRLRQAIKTANKQGHIGELPSWMLELQQEVTDVADELEASTHRVSVKSESYFDMKPVKSLEEEIMKFRRIYRGKEKETHNWRVRWETIQKQAPPGANHLKEIEEHRHDEGQYRLTVDALDETLKRCGIEIMPKYLLKSELKARSQAH
jgi:hypothetical protein